MKIVHCVDIKQIHVSRANAAKKRRQTAENSISLSKMFFVPVVFETSCFRFLRKSTRKNRMSASVSKNEVKTLDAHNPRFLQVLSLAGQTSCPH